ncbi:MAG: penicillin-binding protein 2 [Thermosediminibacteraceae bacterium]|nr:penicillin-binding protein 2 [Thermosediminibacteraceae bacterium]
MVGYRGKTGIERTFDHFLKGGKSKAGILYDGFGQPIPGASKKDVTDVNWGVWLTIDSKMQSAVEKIMDEEIQKGAVVVMDARTGEILAMASRPNYKQYKLEAYLKREDAPLINRAVEAYIPGSIFKIIVLAAALEENVADLDDEFFCSGAKQVGGNIIRCNSYEKGGHGRISLRDAFAYSCNCAFIELGLRLGKVKILEYAEKFGLGKKVLGVLAEEKPGNIPSPQKIYQADLGNLSIGQGNLQITPLQATQMLLTVVRDGIRMTPVLVKKVVDSSGFEVQTELVIHDTEKIISTNTARKLQKALKAVVDYGTGTLSKPPNELFEVAGKTGTAELGDGNNHAWFVGYFPADNPRYIITVFIEKGQSGPLKAAPVFRKIAEEIYFLKGK